MHALGDENVSVLAEAVCHAGNRAAVVAVGGGHQGDRAVFPAVRRPFGKGAVDRPGRTQRLERGQPQTARLVLDEDPADSPLRGQRREFGQRSGLVVGQRGVEAPHLAGRGFTPPGTGIGSREPRQRGKGAGVV